MSIRLYTVASVPSIRLERLSEQHLAGLEQMLEDADVLRFTRVPEPPPPGFPRMWLELYEEGRRDGTREAFAIVDDENAFLGIALAVSINREEQTVELGYVVAP